MSAARPRIRISATPSGTCCATLIPRIQRMHFEMETTPQRHIYNLLIGLVAPRPIAWVTSMDRDGNLNAAPFSAYNYLCTDPPIVALGVTNRPGHDALPKDTARNIRRTGEFVINVVTEDLIQQMNICATDFPRAPASWKWPA